MLCGTCRHSLKLNIMINNTFCEKSPHDFPPQANLSLAVRLYLVSQADAIDEFSPALSQSLLIQKCKPFYL